MAPSKLSAADKRDIIELYRQPGETTSTIADRYGVSGSTISRVLKSTLPDDEYGALIQQKRLTIDKPQPKVDKPQPKVDKPQPKVDKPQPKVDKPQLASLAQPIEMAIKPDTGDVTQAADEAAVDKVVIPPPKIRGVSNRQRSRSAETVEGEETSTQLPLLNMISSPITDSPALQDSIDYALTPADFAGEEEEDEATLAATVLDDVDQLHPDDDYEDDLEDDSIENELEDWEEDEEITPPKLQRKAAVQIIPLTEANLSNPCYLVVDRLAELITRPLRDFGELGQIPETDVQSRTLPVFDNHRVARRFSRRNQRVVKVPDGTILRKTSVYLQEKGITHLLVDGQIYSLT